MGKYFKHLRAKLSQPDFRRGFLVPVRTVSHPCTQPVSQSVAVSGWWGRVVAESCQGQEVPGPGREVLPLQCFEARVPKSWGVLPCLCHPQLVPIGLIIKYILYLRKFWHTYIPRPSGLQKLSAATEICFNCKMVTTLPRYSKIILLSLPLPLAVASLCSCTGPFGLGQRFILVPACSFCYSRVLWRRFYQCFLYLT